MKKMKYAKPMAEITEFSSEDIIRTSALKDTVNNVKASEYVGTNYDDWYNATGGGVITLK